MKHICHWDGCNIPCPPKMWGCRTHWFTLPPWLRNSIWKHYVPGQELRKDPSEGYLVIAWMVQLWIGEFKAGRKLTETEFCGPFLESVRQEAEDKAAFEKLRMEGVHGRG